MNSQYAGNRQIHFLVISHSRRTKHLLHWKMAWIPVIHILLSKRSFPNCIHALYTSMKHGHRKIPSVWAVYSPLTIIIIEYGSQAMKNAS